MLCHEGFLNWLKVFFEFCRGVVVVMKDYKKCFLNANQMNPDFDLRLTLISLPSKAFHLGLNAVKQLFR